MPHSEINELNQVNQFIDEGKVKEAFKFISELEQRDDFSFKEKISCKLVKANLIAQLGNYLDAIKGAEAIFQESQKVGDLLSSFDALVIQAYSYVMMVNVIKGGELVKQAQDLLKIIKETFSIDLRERIFLSKDERNY
ncbi:MAG: hypothetical protein ACFFCI_18350 [Promethearchaeota archaeon]